MSSGRITLLGKLLRMMALLSLVLLAACGADTTPTSVPAATSTTAPAPTNTTAAAPTNTTAAMPTDTVMVAPTNTMAAMPTNTLAAPTNTVAAGSSNIVVVATTTQIRSLAQSVVGDLFQVRSILTPGADAHEFEPRPSDVQAISESSLVLRNGVGLDNWLDGVIANAGGNRPVVTVSDGVTLREGDEEEPAGDPHIWFSVANAMTMTTNISNALIATDPANAATYRANTATFMQTLSDLDKYVMDQIATVPEANRKMVTNHDAFGYFIDRYGLTFVGSIIPSMSTEAEPSAQDVAELIAKIKAENVKAIFLESSINPALAEQVGNDAGVKVVDTLYGDSLGDVGTPGETYEGMMRFNTDTIVAALK